MLNATSNGASLKAYASEFGTGEVGVVLVNTATAAAARVTLRLDELRAAGGLRAAPRAKLNGWMLSAVDGADGATASPLDAPIVAVNGQGNGLPWGGPWPLSAVKPYTRSGAADAPLSLDGLTVDVPAASVTAMIVHPFDAE